MTTLRKIAVAAETDDGLNAQVSHHFGRCPAFVMIDTDGKSIISHETVANPHFTNHQPGMVPQFIHSQKASVILAGGMGPKAINLFGDMNIEVATGAVGNLKAVVEAYLRGEIQGIVPCAHNHEDSCGGH